MGLARYERIPERALAIYAHPDDAQVASGGTLARWAQGGCAMHLVVCTDGAKGSLDPSADLVALSRQRSQEISDSIEALGFSSWEQLGIPDGEVENDKELRRALVEIVRNFVPEVVLSHDPTAVFFGRHYVNHRDHRELGWAVLDAVAPAAGQPHYFPELDSGAHEVHAMFLSGTLEPNVSVDLREVLDAKAKAVAMHRSQFVEEPELVEELVRRRASEDGQRAGCSAAELFRQLDLG